MADRPVECLLVHGWGMNQQVWQPVVERLPDWIHAHRVDLPGHGKRSNESFADARALVDDLQLQCEAVRQPNKPLILVGWSLGALPCLQLAIEKPQLMDALLVVSSNPCFVARDDWKAGVNAEVFDQFAGSLKEDFSGTIRRFLSLQVKGSESGRRTLRELREKILQQPQPHAESLDAGLDILKRLDMREQLSDITQPVSWALGAQDGLVRAELSEELSQLMPAAEVKLYRNAGHAPFLSNTDEFVQQLEQFAQAVVSR